MLSLADIFSSGGRIHNLRKRRGIYALHNVITGKCYIGSAAVNYSTRLSTHIRALCDRRHHSHKLQNSWDEHGVNAFQFVIVEDCEPEKRIEKEQFWMNFYHPEYNINTFALHTGGRPLSEDHKKKLRGPRPQTSASMKGHLFSDETRTKMRMAKLGKPCSEAAKNASRSLFTGIKKSRDVIKRMSDAQKLRWAKRKFK